MKFVDAIELRELAWVLYVFFLSFGAVSKQVQLAGEGGKGIEARLEEIKVR